MVNQNLAKIISAIYNYIIIIYLLPRQLAALSRDWCSLSDNIFLDLAVDSCLIYYNITDSYTNSYFYSTIHKSKGKYLVALLIISTFTKNK